MSSALSFIQVPQDVLAYMFDAYVDLKTRVMCCRVSKQLHHIRVQMNTI